MIWIIISSVLVFILSIWIGKKRPLKLYQITARGFFLFIIGASFTLLIMRIVNDLGFISDHIAAAIMTNTYSCIGGILFGAAYDIYSLKQQAGKLEYSNKNLVTDIIPSLLAVTLLILSFARTGIFNELPITPIRVSSAISILSLGVLIITLSVVPEFKKKGILIIDQMIEWKALTSYKWVSEETIEIEYEMNDTIKVYQTIIPTSDQVRVEKLLNGKMMEKLETEDD